MARIPPLPRFLGYFGLVPQLVAVMLLLTGPPPGHMAAIAVAVLYPALILSFLGGCWWGMAAGAPAAERRNALGWVWVAAVAPTLITLLVTVGWAMRWLAAEAVLVMLGAALLMSVGIDAKLGHLAPRWWMRLRLPLSLVLGTVTLAAAFR